MFVTEDEWRDAIESAKEELAMAYTQGRIDIPSPVDQNITELATAIARRVITSTSPVSA